MSADRPAILVAGSGIGGLSAAISLARANFAVTVLERSAAAPESGAGIQLGPNATRLLIGWGLREALYAAASFPSRISISDGLSGRSIAAVPLGRAAEARYGARYCTLSRAGLHRILLEAAAGAGATILYDFPVSEFSADGDFISVRANGKTAAGGALIGADGLRSAVRSSLYPGARPGGDGRIAWRSQLPAAQALEFMRENAVRLWLRPDCHAVAYPAGGAALNLVVVTGAHHPAAGRQALLPEDFQSWPGPARILLQSAQSWKSWPVLTLDPLPAWSRGRIALLGDAAHPMAPFLASGAVMAIEDAAVLAQEAARTPLDLPAAFQRYERARMPRAARAARQSRQMGEIYHMSGLMRAARNAVLAMTPPSRLLARNDWLYGFRATSAGAAPEA